jgi:hypothetical protein
MSAEQAIQILDQIDEFEKQNAKQVETLKKRGDEAKELLLRHMQTNNLPYIPHGSKYLVINRKRTKATLSEELVKIVYRSFRTQVGGHSPSEEETDAFMTKIEEARVKLGAVTVKLATSKTKPLSSLVV